MPIFLSSDDSKIKKELKSLLGNNVSIYSAKQKERTGYDQVNFNRLGPKLRWEEAVFFLFELEMMANSTYFVGGSPSNVFYWTRYRRGNRNVLDAGGGDSSV